MQAALYARVSTRDKRQDTENQLAQLRSFAASQNWTVAHEYVDRATGKHSDREQFQRLFQYGVDYRSLTEQYLDSCGIFKDAVLSILATIAKQERIRLSERVHAGLAKARREGRVGGRPRLVLNHAKLMQLEEEGYSIREIAEEMGI